MTSKTYYRRDHEQLWHVPAGAVKRLPAYVKMKCGREFWSQEKTKEPCLCVCRRCEPEPKQP